MMAPGVGGVGGRETEATINSDCVLVQEYEQAYLRCPVQT